MVGNLPLCQATRLALMPTIGETDTQGEVSVSPLETGRFLHGVAVQIAMWHIKQGLVNRGRDTDTEPAGDVKIITNFDRQHRHQVHHPIRLISKPRKIVINHVEAKS